MPALVQLLAAAAPAEPDADLLARFVSTRDGAAFADLVRRHGPTVLGTCRRLVGWSAADDAFQATFLVLAARAGSVRKAASVGSWLVGVAGRVGRRMRQREDRRQRTEDRRRQSVGDGADYHPDLCPESSDLSAVLADEFTRLPDKLRAAAVACLLDGRTQDQAAAVLGWSSRTVRRRLDEAKELLRARLERRGVAPAAVAAALAACGETTAIPPALTLKTTDGATLFLAGGGADLPAAALAHGVLGAMTTIRSTAAAAVCVAVLAGLGVGWANDAATPDPDRVPAPAAKAPPAPAAPASHVHKTANFEVTAPTAAVARALGEEFERQRSKSAIAWSGADLPAWKQPVTIRFEAAPPGAKSPYRAEVRFRSLREEGDGGWFDGTLESHLNWHAPVLADRFVVHTLLDRLPPWWAFHPLWLIANPDAAPVFWANTTVPVRRQLEDGAALRLGVLFAYKQRLDDDGLYQAVSVTGFLLTRSGDGRSADARRTYLRFLKAGGDGWEKAAKDVYGFASLREMEQAWIDWVRAEPAPLPKAADPDRIPPPAEPRATAEPSATVGTPNFVVSAPSADVAKAVSLAAEKHRRDVGKRWFGGVPPDLTAKVPVRVTITPGDSGGATTFTFGEADGKRAPGVKSASMELRGPLDAVLKSVLPHEVTHVVLATHFGRPLPRWADEGIAVLSEADADQFNHEVRARELLNAGRAIRLSTLFRMTEYPRDSVVTFAQGHSVCRFLLDRGAAGPNRGREAALVAFLSLGMGENSVESWALAAREVYGLDSLDALEAAWIESLRAPPRRR
jgi:RNA polymerase sigma factor (sigma-70 family)